MLYVAVLGHVPKKQKCSKNITEMNNKQLFMGWDFFISQDSLSPVKNLHIFFRCNDNLCGGDGAH